MDLLKHLERKQRKLNAVWLQDFRKKIKGETQK